MADSHARGRGGDSAALARLRSDLRFSTRLAAIAIVVAFCAESASAQVSPRRAEDSPSAPPASSLVRPNTWNIDGVVNAIAQSGNTIYFGGEFSIHDTHAGCGVPMDPNNGTIATSFPAVTGVNSIVYAAADDGAGGWYIGGDFSEVGGLPRNRLAHILADGTVTPWNPGADYWVRAIAVDGDVVYVGGQFTMIGGQARHGLAAVDGSTGEILPWNPGLDGGVGALTVNDHTLYIGGGFSSILGQSRSAIAAFDLRSRNLTDWNPGASGYVSCLAVHGDVVYVGGDFLMVGGVERHFIAAVDASTGVTTAWNAHVAPSTWDPDFGWASVFAITVTDRAVYVGGYFNGIGGATRAGVAALDPSSAAALPWNPTLFAGYFDWVPFVLAIEVSGPNVFIGGSFYGGAGKTYSNFMVTDTEYGTLRPWNTAADLGVAVIAPGRDHVFVGGAFKKFEQTRWCLASIDATTGALNGWNSDFIGTRVNALAVRDSFLYVGGKFDLVAGGGGSGLAEINTRTGAATRFMGSTNGEVHSLLATDSRLYVGGAFTTLYGLPFAFPAPPRNGLGAYELDSGPSRGVLSTWDPQAHGEVDALALDDATLLVGGRFDQMGGESRASIAALDTSTGLATSWNPSADGPVNALLASDGTVLAGGDFGSIGGAQRRGLAVLDSNTGLASAWDPGADGRVDALLESAGTLYVGGAFQNIGGQPRGSLAALSEPGGRLLPWDPQANGEVRALAARAWTVYAGGAFTSVSDVASEGLVALRAAAARVALPDAQSPTRKGSALTLMCAPSPVRSEVTIDFSIPSADRVTLALYDLAGRRVACPLEGLPLAAGSQQLTVRVEAWPAGCYFCRLTVGAKILTRKLVVVR